MSRHPRREVKYVVLVVCMIAALLSFGALRVENSRADSTYLQDAELVNMAVQLAATLGIVGAPSEIEYGYIPNWNNVQIPESRDGSYLVRKSDDLFIYRMYGSFSNVVVWGLDGGGSQVYSAIDLRLNPSNGELMSSAYYPQGTTPDPLTSLRSSPPVPPLSEPYPELAQEGQEGD